MSGSGRERGKVEGGGWEMEKKKERDKYRDIDGDVNRDSEWECDRYWDIVSENDGDRERTRVMEREGGGICR